MFVALATILATGLATVGVVGTAAVAVLSAGLPDPKASSTPSRSPSRRVVYDRTGHGRARPLPARAAPGRHVRRGPAARPRRDDHGRGPDVLDERRLRPAGDPVGRRRQARRGARERGASTITQQLVRARLLPADVDRARRRPLPAQGQGADPVVAPDRRVPGRGRQGADHHRLPQRDLLRPRRVRDRGRGPDLLRRHRPREADAGPGGAARRPAQVALDPRPVPLRREGRQGPARRPGRRRRRSSAATGSSRASRRRALDAADAEPSSRRRSPSRSSWPASSPLTYQGRRTSPGRSAASSSTILGGADKVETGGYTVITTLDWRAQQLAEKWLTAARDRPEPARASSGDALLEVAEDRRSATARWINALRGKDLHNGALVALDYRTGDVLAYVGSAGYYRDDLASREVRRRSTTPPATASRQPGSAFKPIVYATAFDAKRA